MASPTNDEELPCPRVTDVAPYLQGELPEPEREQFERHMECCAVCREHASAFREVIRTVKDSAAHAASRDLAPDIRGKLPPQAWRPLSESGRRFEWFPYLARIAALLFCAFAIGVTWVLLRTEHGHPYLEHRMAILRATLERRPGSAPRGGEESLAIRKALDWLESTQEPAGHWAAAKWGAQESFTAGITALSLLAFLDAGHESLAGSRLEAVRRGTAYLVGQQDAAGRIGPACAGAPYNGGIATLALLEAADRGVNAAGCRAAAGRAVQLICASQDETGGWGYADDRPGTANTSITIWQLLALIRADSLGVEGLKPRIERGLRWLETTVNDEGWMGYTRANDFPYGRSALTAAGALCLMKAGGTQVDRNRIARMKRVLRSSATEPAGQVDYYRWYFLAAALRSNPEPDSAPLLTRIHQNLLAQQDRTGPAAGSWTPGDRWSATGGKIYCTAMAAMALR